MPTIKNPLDGKHIKAMQRTEERLYRQWHVAGLCDLRQESALVPARPRTAGRAAGLLLHRIWEFRCDSLPGAKLGNAGACDCDCDCDCDCGFGFGFGCGCGCGCDRSVDENRPESDTPGIFSAIGVFEPVAQGVRLISQADDLLWYARELACLRFAFDTHHPPELRDASAMCARQLLRLSRARKDRV